MKKNLTRLFLKAFSAVSLMLATFSVSLLCCECIWFQPAVPEDLAKSKK